jgi:hypothetical protein
MSLSIAAAPADVGSIDEELPMAKAIQPVSPYDSYRNSRWRNVLDRYLEVSARRKLLKRMLLRPGALL